MAGLPPLRYGASVSWEKRVAGYFTIGVSLIGGPDGLAPSAYSSTFAGPFDDISADLEEVSLGRGHDPELQGVSVGRCALTVRDHYVSGGLRRQGKYNAKNTDSPLYGKLRPMRPVRLEVVHDGMTYPRFYGFLRNGEARPGPRRGTAVLDCFDFLGWLGEEGAPRPVIASTGPTTTGAAIGKILDAVGWTEAAMRDLGVGDALADFSADGSMTALDLLGELLASEQGHVHITGAGVVVYRDRHHWAGMATMATITDEFPAVAPGFSLDHVKNRARVVRLTGTHDEPVEGPVQEASDATSASEFGTRDHNELKSFYLGSNADALGLAQYLVSRSKDPRTQAWSLDLEARTDDLAMAILMAEPGDRVTVAEHATGPAGTTGDFFVARIEERGATRGAHSAKWILIERPAVLPFRIGVSLIGGPDVLTY
jgi:hypothetical protein